MNVKIGDTIKAKAGYNNTIREGKVIAIGIESVVVRVTRESLDEPGTLGDLYEIEKDWFEGKHAFYEVDRPFFRIGETYAYKGSAITARYRVMGLMHLDNPLPGHGNAVAFSLATNAAGEQWGDVLGSSDFEHMEVV